MGGGAVQLRGEGGAGGRSGRGAGGRSGRGAGGRGGSRGGGGTVGPRCTGTVPVQTQWPHRSPDGWGRPRRAPCQLRAEDAGRGVRSTDEAASGETPREFLTP